MLSESERNLGEAVSKGGKGFRHAAPCSVSTTRLPFSPHIRCNCEITAIGRTYKTPRIQGDSEALERDSRGVPSAIATATSLNQLATIRGLPRFRIPQDEALGSSAVLSSFRRFQKQTVVQYALRKARRIHAFLHGPAFLPIPRGD